MSYVWVRRKREDSDVRKLDGMVRRCEGKAEKRRQGMVEDKAKVTGVKDFKEVASQSGGGKCGELNVV